MMYLLHCHEILFGVWYVQQATAVALSVPRDITVQFRSPMLFSEIYKITHTGARQGICTAAKCFSRHDPAEVI